MKKKFWNWVKNEGNRTLYLNEGKSKCDMKAIDDATLKAVFLRMFNKLYESKEDFFKTFTDNIDKVLKQSVKMYSK